MVQLSSENLVSRSMRWRDFRDQLGAIDLVRHDGDGRAFSGRIVDDRFGPLVVRKVGSSGVALRGERSPQRITRCHENLLWMCLLLRGDMIVEQRGERTELGQGDLVFLDAVRPYRFDVSETVTDSLWIGVPRGLAETRIYDIDEVLARRIDGSDGIGLMTASMMRAVFATTSPTIDDGVAGQVGRALVGVLGATADSCRLDQPGSRYRNAVVRRIKAYVDEHIGDDTLSVARIAGDQGMSTRYLAKMFEGEARTISNWIWDRRLELCRLALAEAAEGQRISDIAYAHGFKNMSHFSRAFRERYAVSPSEVFRADARLH